MHKAEAAPFGLEPAQPAFDRATRLAKLLFGALESSIVLIDGERVWRSRAGSGKGTGNRAGGARMVMESGEPLWVEDLSVDPRFTDHATYRELGVRFYAAAPVRLDDGATPGVISV